MGGSRPAISSSPPREAPRRRSAPPRISCVAEPGRPSRGSAVWAQPRSLLPVASRKEARRQQQRPDPGGPVRVEPPGHRDARERTSLDGNLRRCRLVVNRFDVQENLLHLLRCNTVSRRKAAAKWDKIRNPSGTNHRSGVPRPEIETFARQLKVPRSIGASSARISSQDAQAVATDAHGPCRLCARRAYRPAPFLPPADERECTGSDETNGILRDSVETL
jgi:hypothetical protein